VKNQREVGILSYPGNVVSLANAIGIHSITEWPSLFLSSHTRITVDLPRGISSPCEERYGLTLFHWNDTIG
jgi:hypothetical protein